MDDALVDAALRALVAGARFEIIPMKGAAEALAALPVGAAVSVTCSPVKGVDATLDLVAEVIAAGHCAMPHLAARMVDGPAHVARIAERLRRLDVREVFVIAGDAPHPAGPYEGSYPFLEDLLAAAPELRHVGIAAYPDRHPFIDDDTLRHELRRKAALLAAAGLDAHATTQMCFNPATTRNWLASIRRDGLDLPVHLGVPGAVDRAKLISLGVRLGVGSSLRYLRKNAGVLKMMGPTHYEPDHLLEPLADELAGFGVEGLHLFTFNQVARTAAWQARFADRPARSR
ncbi:MAG: methylenetetrahydrofolate reductase [Acidimicrobiales bacterium]|nr:methylenetetrahydrofolate reductase [Acidimicrobiales bacterium]